MEFCLSDPWHTTVRKTGLGFAGSDFGFLLEEFCFLKYQSIRPLHDKMFSKHVDFFTSHDSCSFIGSDIKGNTIVPESEVSNAYEDQSVYFFEKYSKDLLVEVKEHFWKGDPNQDLPNYGFLVGFLVGLQSKHGACSFIRSWEKSMCGHPLESTGLVPALPPPPPCGYQNPQMLKSLIYITQPGVCM